MSATPGTFKNRPPQPIEIPISDTDRQAIMEEAAEMSGALLYPTFRRYALGQCNVLVDREPAGAGGALLWHLSISHLTRYPTWDEIKVARYELTPHDVSMAMILPRPDEFVNVPAQDNVFHLWEIDDPRGAA